MEELSKKTTCTQILDALNEMPKDLPEMYSRILSMTEKSRRPTLCKLLRWVTMAVRPLTIKELAAAMEIVHTEHLPGEQIVLDYISMCGTMLQINDGKVGFVHQSAIDYLLEGDSSKDTVLEDFHITEGIAHSEMAARCIDCMEGSILSHKRLMYNEIPEHSKSNALLNYAVSNWFKHAKDGSASLNKDLILERDFFKKRSKTRDNWLSTCLFGLDGVHFSRSNSSLNIAASLGIEAWVEMELRKRSKLMIRLSNFRDEMSSLTGPPIVCAVKNQHAAIVKLLLEGGAARDGNTEALNRAVILRNKAIVRLLLERCTYWEQDLICAMIETIRNPDPPIARMLLDHDARKSIWINSSPTGAFQEFKLSSHERLAIKLSAAMTCGHSTMIPVLINNIKHFDYETYPPFFHYHTFLMTVVRAGDIQAIKLLLARGADINQRTRLSETALSTAISNKLNIPVVKFLLESGSDIKTDVKAFHCAVRYGTENALRILLEYGVDPNATCPNGKSAFDVAFKRGDKQIERLLREFVPSRESAAE